MNDSQQIILVAFFTPIFTVAATALAYELGRSMGRNWDTICGWWRFLVFVVTGKRRLERQKKHRAAMLEQERQRREKRRWEKRMEQSEALLFWQADFDRACRAHDDILPWIPLGSGHTGVDFATPNELRIVKLSVGEHFVIRSWGNQ